MILLQNYYPVSDPMNPLSLAIQKQISFSRPSDSILLKLNKQQRKLQHLIREYTNKYSKEKHQIRNVSEDFKVKKRVKSTGKRVHTINLEMSVGEDDKEKSKEKDALALPKIRSSGEGEDSFFRVKGKKSFGVKSIVKDSSDMIVIQSPGRYYNKQTSDKDEFIKKSRTQREVSIKRPSLRKKNSVWGNNRSVMLKLNGSIEREKSIEEDMSVPIHQYVKEVKRSISRQVKEEIREMREKNGKTGEQKGLKEKKEELIKMIERHNNQTRASKKSGRSISHLNDTFYERIR